MRVISMHKVDAAMEAGGRPSQELIQGMGKLMGDMRRNGVFLDGDGLQRSATRVRLQFSGGERTLQRGPYAGSNERIHAVLQLKVRDMDEAVEWASRYGRALDDVELEIGPVTEAWDLGIIPKPAEAPLRCLVLHKSDADAEAGRPLGKKASAAVATVIDEMRKAGVLQGAERLQPTSRGMRIKVAGKKPTIVDGPFAEAKELIAGFVVLELPSLAAAREWCLKFAEVIGDVEMDVIPMEDAF
jgi:hypothetical protein